MRRKVYQDALNKAIDFNLNRIKRPNPSTRIQVNDFNLKRSKNIIPITRTEVSELNLNRAKKITPIPLGALKVKGGKGKRYIAPTYDINIDYNLANVPITSFDPSGNENDRPRINTFREDGEHVIYVNAGGIYEDPVTHVQTTPPWGDNSTGFFSHRIPINDAPGEVTLSAGVDVFTADYYVVELTPDIENWTVTTTNPTEKKYQLLLNSPGVTDITVNIINPGFNLTSDKYSVNEGESFTITLEAFGIENDTLIPYTITGIQDTDILESLSGNFEIYGNVATATFNVIEDLSTEGTETFTITLDNNQASTSVQINDTSIDQFTLSANKTFVTEGDSFTIALSTHGISDDVLVPYTITGVTSADISGASLSGNFTINNNIDTKTFNVSADFNTESTETFTLTLDDQSSVNVSVTIEDTSVETFNLSANKVSVNEGESFTISLSTQGVFDNTSVPYTITGVTSADISFIPLSGVFTINNNLATSAFSVSADNLTEGLETFTLSLDNGKDSQSVFINDTSVALINQPLRILQIGGGSNHHNARPFNLPPRSNNDPNGSIWDSNEYIDTLSGFSPKSYVYPTDHTQTSLSNTIGNLASDHPSFLTLGEPFNQNSDYFDSIIDPSRTFTHFTGGFAGIPFNETQSSEIDTATYYYEMCKLYLILSLILKKPFLKNHTSYYLNLPGLN